MPSDCFLRRPLCERRDQKLLSLYLVTPNYIKENELARAAREPESKRAFGYRSGTVPVALAVSNRFAPRIFTSY